MLKKKTTINLNNNESLDKFHKNFAKKNPFENKSIFLVLLRFCVPAILVTLFQSLYVFADQIMIIKFVPNGTLNPSSIYSDAVFGGTYKQYTDIITGLGATPLDIHDLIRAAVSISAPITVILNAITLLVSMGVSISFSKALGKNDTNELQKVWSTGFTTNLVVGLVCSLFILGISPVWLSTSATGVGDTINAAGLTPDQKKILEDFSQKFQQLQISYAQNYIFILSGFNILQVFTQMYYLLSQSEGRQLFISIVPTFCNVVNVVFDYILIRYTDLGLSGAAFATVIGYALNFGSYFIYSIVLSHQNRTNLDLRKLRFKLFTWSYLSIILLIGLASFLRNTSLSLSSSLFQTYLVTVAKSTGAAVHNGGPNYYQSIFGSVTPISNLALQSIWGVIQGGRAVASYKYGKKDYKAIKVIFWQVALISMVYGVLIYFIFSFAIAQPLLTSLFDVIPQNLDQAVLILKITMIQSIFIALAANSQLYFQSTQRVTLSWLSSIMQGVITFIPLLFIFQAAANSINGEAGMMIFIWLQSANAIIAGVINLFIGIIHLYFFMGKKEQRISLGINKKYHFFKKVKQI